MIPGFTDVVTERLTDVKLGSEKLKVGTDTVSLALV
jgi:hypothetical protein